MNTFLALALILVIIIDLSTIFLVASRSASSLRRDAYILGHVFAALWATGALLASFSSDAILAKVGFELFNIPPVFAIYFVFVYFYSYLSPRLTFAVKMLFATSILVSLQTFLVGGYTLLAINPDGLNTFSSAGNFAYEFYFLNLVLLIIAVAFQAIRSIDNHPVRMRLKYTAAGGIATVSCAVFFNIVLINLNINTAIWTGPIFTPFYSVAATFAILRFNLFEMPQAASRLVSYRFVLITVGSIYFSIVGALAFSLGSDNNTAILVALLSLIFVSIALFRQLLKAIDGATNNFFHRQDYNFEKTVADFSSQLSAISDSKDAVTLFSRIIEDSLKPDFVKITSGRMGGNSNPGLITTLEIKGQKNQTVLVGEKKSGEKYTMRDTLFFQVTTTLLKLSLSNIERLSRLDSLNASLIERVNEATKEIRSLDEAKDTFIELAAHQLKSPVASTEQSLALLSSDLVDKKSKHILSLATESSQRTAQLIEEMLTITKASLGKLDLEFAPQNIKSLIEKQIAITAPLAKQKNIKILMNIGPRLPNLVAFDEKYIREAASNLIENSIKYSRKNSSIEVNLTADPHSFALQVTDCGIGIAKKDQPKVFNKFYRARNAQKIEQGTGLGLFLVKQVVEQHGGEIIFKSELNKGSTFGFKLPLQP